MLLQQVGFGAVVLPVIGLIEVIAIGKAFGQFLLFVAQLSLVIFAFWPTVVTAELVCELCVGVFECNVAKHLQGLSCVFWMM